MGGEGVYAQTEYFLEGFPSQRHIFKMLIPWTLALDHLIRLFGAWGQTFVFHQ